LSCVGRGLA